MALKQSGCPLVELDVSTNEVVYKGAVAAASLAAIKQPGGFAALNLDANYISDEAGGILRTSTRPTLNLLLFLLRASV